MPITNEYSWNGGSRQDFQLGYLQWTSSDNVTVHTSGYIAPGWVGSGYWDKDFSYLFAMAYERNGGVVTVGYPKTDDGHGGTVYQDGPYWRQNFHGGSYQDCCIMYDPNDQPGNPASTNQAYLLRTGFYNFYQANGGQNAYGCPTRDEYPIGSSGDAIQFFDKRVGGVTQQHHMYFHQAQPYLCPEGPVCWHSTYTTAYDSQTPSGQFVWAQGTAQTVTVKFKNTGQFIWYNDPNAYPYDYVQLKSCDASGVVCNSFLNDPFNGSIGWIDAQTPCTMVESSVAPGSVATFTFTGKVASGAPLGLKGVYFRPEHSVGGLMDDWGGMYFPVKVIRPPYGLILRNPSTANWYDRVSVGNAFAFPSGPNSPADLWLSGWAQDGGSGYTFTAYSGDLSGDGYDDLIVERSDCNWYVAWNNRNGSFTAQGSPILSPWGTSPSPGKYFFWFGDFTGDQKDDLLTYDASNGNWYVSIFNTSTNTFDSYSTWITWGGGIGTFQPLVGDWNGDGKKDICLRNPSTGNHYVRLSNGSSFYQATNDNWIGFWGASSAFTPLVGDWNGDGKDDLCLFNSSTGDHYVRLSNGSNFYQGTNDNWLGGWTGSGYILFVGDFNDDGKTDIGLRDPVNGNHWVRMSSGSAFTQPSPDNWQSGWGASTSFQLLTGRFGNGGSGTGYSMQPAPPGDDQPPSSGAVSFRMWTEPNPAVSSATINFTLPTADWVSIKIYDVGGREMAKMPQQAFDPGEHSFVWGRAGLKGQPVPNGLYFVRLVSHLYAATSKVVVIN